MESKPRSTRFCSGEKTCLAELINDVIYILDREGVVEFINPAIEKVTGYAPEEVIGRPYVDFIFPADVSFVRQKFNELKAGIQSESDYRIVSRARYFPQAH